jgi:hypothetical protein
VTPRRAGSEEYPAPARPTRRRGRRFDDEADGPAPDPEPPGRIRQAFKCRNCRAFIGEPVSGGRNRNHCPACLYSLHVDDRTPGDRRSDCRSLMEPIGVYYRRNGEQMLVHRCLGCGRLRQNRVAADDNPPAVEALPETEYPDGTAERAGGE